MSRKANLPSRSHRPSFPRPLPSRCGVPRFAAPAAYGFPRRRGFQHSDGRRVPRLTRSLSECWKPRQVCPPFPPSRRLFRAFNGRRVPSPTRRLLEGWESRPRVPVPATTPRLHAARRAAPKKPKKKGTLSDAPWFLCPNSSQSPDTPTYLLRTHARLAHCNSLSSCEPCTGRNTW